MYFFSFFSKTLLLFSDAYDFTEILKTATFPGELLLFKQTMSLHNFKGCFPQVLFGPFLNILS